MKNRRITHIAASLIGAAFLLSPLPAQGESVPPPLNEVQVSTAWDRIEQDRTALKESVAEAELAIESLIADTDRHGDLRFTLEELEKTRAAHVAFTYEQEQEALSWAESELDVLVIRSLALLRMGPNAAVVYLEDINRSLRGDDRVEDLIRSYKKGHLIFVEGIGYPVPSTSTQTLEDLEKAGLVTLTPVPDGVVVTHGEKSLYVTEEGVEMDGELVSTQRFSQDHLELDQIMTLFGYENVEGRYWAHNRWIYESIEPEAIIKRAYIHHLKEETP